METLRAVGILLVAIAVVFGIAYWKDKRASKKKKNAI
jgi:hypothetical protein